MGYPIFGKVKTIVLPLSINDITLDEYKDKYGIDLRDFIVLEDGQFISFNNGMPNSLIIIDDVDLAESNIRLNTVKKAIVQEYIAGERDATYGLVFLGDGENSGAIWQLYILNTAEFKIENVRVRNLEI